MAVDRRSSRQRRPPARLDNGGDEFAVQQALRRSLLEQKRVVHEVPEAPVFQPSAEEFADFFGYIASIRDVGEAAGIVKIKVPEGWKPPFTLQMRRPFVTKRQRLHHLQEGLPFDDGSVYTQEQYQRRAQQFMQHWLAQHPDIAVLVEAASEGGAHARAVAARALEDEYWRIVERVSDEEVTVDYANDLDSRKYGSGFTERPGGARGWDLNTLFAAPASVLRKLEANVEGVTYPWMYFGMLFATFCWHNEDHFLNSINFHHAGAAKTWYGVPASTATRFEECMRQCVPERFKEERDLLHQLVTLAPPSLLLERGVKVVRTLQEEGDMIVTFPKAYHSGFSHGWNATEAVNFAACDWFPYGFEAVEKYTKGAGKREPVFSHDRLLWLWALEAIRRTGALPDPLLARSAGSLGSGEALALLPGGEDDERDKCLMLLGFTDLQAGVEGEGEGAAGGVGAPAGPSYKLVPVWQGGVPLPHTPPVCYASAAECSSGGWAVAPRAVQRQATGTAKLASNVKPEQAHTTAAAPRANIVRHPAASGASGGEEQPLQASAPAPDPGASAAPEAPSGMHVRPHSVSTAAPVNQEVVALLHQQAEVGEGDSRVLAAELERLAAPELRLRATLRRAGILEASAGQAEAAPAGGEMEACAHCGYVPYLSYVRCMCKPKQLRCLAHAHIGCFCLWPGKRLVIRITDGQLHAARRQLQPYMKQGGRFAVATYPWSASLSARPITPSTSGSASSAEGSPVPSTGSGHKRSGEQDSAWQPPGKQARLPAVLSTAGGPAAPAGLACTSSSAGTPRGASDATVVLAVSQPVSAPCAVRDSCASAADCSSPPGAQQASAGAAHCQGADAHGVLQPGGCGMGSGQVQQMETLALAPASGEQERPGGVAHANLRTAACV